MKKTIFIHIGAHKTGTTAIQSFLAMNRNNLKRMGFLYPSSSNAHHRMGREIAGIAHETTQTDEQSYTARIFSEIRNTECHTIILSSETFTRCDIADRMRQAIQKNLDDSFTISIILYCRRQDQLIQSAYQQRLKTPDSEDQKELREYLKQNTYLDMWDYDKKIQPWADTFGKEHIIIRTYEKGQFYNNDLLSDFAHIIGLDNVNNLMYPDKERSNIGLGPDLIEIIRIAYRNNPDPDFRKFIKMSLEEINRKKKSEPYSYLSPQESIGLLEKFDGSNRKVAYEYLGREDGRLFYEARPDPDDPWTPYKGLTVEKFVPIFTELIYTIDCRYNNQITAHSENRVTCSPRYSAAWIKTKVRSIFRGFT